MGGLLRASSCLCPFVVSLSNHGRIALRLFWFDGLTTNGCFPGNSIQFDAHRKTRSQAFPHEQTVTIQGRFVSWFETVMEQAPSPQRTSRSTEKGKDNGPDRGSTGKQARGRRCGRTCAALRPSATAARSVDEQPGWVRWRLRCLRLQPGCVGTWV